MVTGAFQSIRSGRTISSSYFPSEARLQSTLSIKTDTFGIGPGEAIPIFFNRLKSDFFPCPIAIKFSPVTGYELKFVKM